jgi:hypothetical protein
MTTVITQTTEVQVTENVTDLDPSMEAKIVEFNAMKAAIKTLEAQKAAAEVAIREALAGSDIGRINGVERVRVQHRNMTKVDRELLKTAFPEAHEATQVVSAYTVLQAK